MLIFVDLPSVYISYSSHRAQNDAHFRGPTFGVNHNSRNFIHICPTQHPITIYIARWLSNVVFRRTRALPNDVEYHSDDASFLNPQQASARLDK